MARIPREAKDDVRRRLLEAAAHHFAARGLEGTSIDGIALAAGFAKGTIYNYFPSKEELFAEVLAEGCRRAAERYASAPHEGSVRACLGALAAADVAVLREDKGFTKVVVREAMSFRPQTYPLLVTHLAPYLGKVQEVLERGVAAQEIRADRPPGELALAFVGVLALLYVQHWGSGGTWPALDEIPSLAVSLFLDGAAHPGQEGPR